jgi:hypothetical protein
MFVAGSNPCFEFWLLLHVQKISNITLEETNLLLENRKISNRKRFIDKYLGNILDDGYNKTNPKPERFFPYIKLAIKQGEELNSTNEDFPTNLGSHVYKIIERLIK